jgi:hypothetical protein
LFNPPPPPRHRAGFLAPEKLKRSLPSNFKQILKIRGKDDGFSGFLKTSFGLETGVPDTEKKSLIQFHDPACQHTVPTVLSFLFGEGITRLLKTQDIYVISFFYTVASCHMLCSSVPECWICYDSDRLDAGSLIQPCACKVCLLPA